MYLIVDLETESHSSYRRKGNPFDKRNWVIMRGWKKQGDTRCSMSHHKEYDRTSHLKIDDDVTILVGHNIKFDILYELAQGNTGLIKFFERGGRIWDTQYAHYLLNGMRIDTHMNSLNDIAPMYGGTKKIDAIKEMWDQGILTSNMPVDLLTDYLIGTEEEGRNGGDIGNTELVFLGQIAMAANPNGLHGTTDSISMMKMIHDRMDGLLATTFMEFFGLKVDRVEAETTCKNLQAELDAVNEQLDAYIPDDLPFEFNWASPIHASCLVFGGGVKYQKQARYRTDDGEWARSKEKAVWPVFGGVATDPAQTTLDEHTGLRRHLTTGEQQDVFKGGIKKGQGKTKNVTVDGDFKTRYTDFVYDFKGLTQPNQSWATSRNDAHGAPVYSLSGEVIGELGKRGLKFTDALARKQLLDKELGTYYLKDDGKKQSGMLLCVQEEDDIIHPSINHTSTVTSRLSSSAPNSQNFPRKDESKDGTVKSRVKKMFVSRFGKHGRKIEADYSQLEVVVQGVLSGDANLCEDLRQRIDFHCKRVAAKHHITYQEAYDWCKNGASIPALEASGYVGDNERTRCKVFSFQRAYGAGAGTIADSTGMTVDEVEQLIDAEKALYPDVETFYTGIEKRLAETSRPFNAKNDYGGYSTFRRGIWQSPTGTIFSWRTYPAQDWQKARGIDSSFSPPEIRNYPIQGTGGEFVQAMAGRLIRLFLQKNFYGGKAFMINTVHDCFWFDAHEDVYEEVARDVKRVMESIPEYYNKRYGMNITVPFPVDVEFGHNMNDLGHFPKGFFG